MSALLILPHDSQPIKNWFRWCTCRYLLLWLNAVTMHYITLATIYRCTIILVWAVAVLPKLWNSLPIKGHQNGETESVEKLIECQNHPSVFAISKTCPFYIGKIRSLCLLAFSPNYELLPITGTWLSDFTAKDETAKAGYQSFRKYRPSLHAESASRMSAVQNRSQCVKIPS